MKDVGSIADLERTVRSIHDLNVAMVIAVTGGGASAISHLLSWPGGSRTVLEAIVPYSPKSLNDFLGTAPAQYCSSATARSMAMVAYQRASQLLVPDRAADAPNASLPSRMALGVGCTASLASEPPKRGTHRVHVAVQSATRTRVVSLELEKGTRTRFDEEQLVGRLIVGEIARACGCVEELTIDTQSRESLIVRDEVAPDWLVKLWSGELVAVGAERRVVVEQLGPGEEIKHRAIMSGAFNPLHLGHEEMARLASQRLGSVVDFEISVTNVDKPPLDFIEVSDRLKQFESVGRIWLTRAPTFVQKATVFRDATFVVGADTMVRIGEPRYYSGNDMARDQAIENLRRLGARFLVFGRSANERFCTLGDLDIPNALRSLGIGVDESTFRRDISSTEIRRQRTESESCP